MVAKDPLVTCHCNFCRSPVKFQGLRAGESINCPNCGMETVLFLPDSTPPYAKQKFAVEAQNIAWVTSPLRVRNLVGEVINNSSSHLNWVRIEFVLYDQAGTLVGHASDCLIGFPVGKQWKFCAPVFQKDAVRPSLPVLSCEYGTIYQAAAPAASQHKTGRAATFPAY